MRLLYLLRHAKSDWAAPGTRDLDRPLAPRGIKAATRIGQVLADRDESPELILCSPARRARETLERALVALDPEPPVDIREDLYLTGWPILLAAIRGIPDGVGRALLVSHNPDLHDLTRRLAGDGDPRALRALEDGYPTGALAILEFPGPGWSDVAPGAGLLRDFIRPRELT